MFIAGAAEAEAVELARQHWDDLADEAAEQDHWCPSGKAA